MAGELWIRRGPKVGDEMTHKDFDLQELKLFQITLAQELCVDESSAAPILDVRQALDAGGGCALKTRSGRS